MSPSLPNPRTFITSSHLNDIEERGLDQVGIGSVSRTDDPYHDEAAVRQAVRDAIRAAGYGRSDSEAPLRDLIRPGSSVLIKPNWVHHRNLGGHGTLCLFTHASVLRAALFEVLRTSPRQVTIADAPIQDCDWRKVVDDDLQRSCYRLAGDVPLHFLDLRRAVLRTEDLAQGVEADIRSLDRYALFDLGSDSLLEPITTSRPSFRITKYDPRELARRHFHGHHEYLLAKEPFEADAILNLPKLKMHGKAGMTGALKNLVGLNGNKDYLPHHRVGGSAVGGDCYPGLAPLKRVSEALIDRANMCIGTPRFRVWRSLASMVHRLHIKATYDTCNMEGMWHGNDTCWRMVCDLNRILLYGSTNGTMSDERQRRVLTLTDAIVCGEHDGPLAPQPVFCGAVTFSANAVAADLVHAALLRLDANRIPLLRGAREECRWPLWASRDSVVHSTVARLSLFDVAKSHGINATPPRGWVGSVEWEDVRCS